MSYIGNSPITAAFLTDQFSGNGTTTAFTMSVAPANTSSIIVAITGVVQDPSTYSVSGTTLTFSAAPPTGTSNISVRFLGIPASGVTTTAYRTVTDTTATAGQTSFSIPSYTVGYLNVFRNGSLLAGSDYTATTGTTVVLANAASAGDTITTESFYVSSVLNALPTTGGSISGQLTVNSATGQKPLIAQVNGTEVFEVDASGNVGVGTASPSDKLDVAGNIRTTATTSTSYYRAQSTSGVCFFGIDSSTASTFGVGNYSRVVYSSGAYPLVFFTNDAERMRIDSNGILLVNNTTADTNYWVKIAGTGAARSPLKCQITDTTSGATQIGFANPNGVIGSITTSGSATAYNTSSDYRLKENVSPMVGALNRVAALNPVTFKWKIDGVDGEGFIAHELQAVVPDAVNGAKDAVDVDGNPVYQGIDTSFLVATLTAAIQEQQALITQLQADVAALKGNA